ncbi:MAG: flagellar biosynthesis anti-sigma factor FlgM [Comamonadaceae bacterium]|nr:MAG: flagellar biosynthesis anti-sigma factor FlgM [Comamonadaceae bacterium]
MKINALNDAALAAASLAAAGKTERGGASAGTGAPDAAGKIGGSGVPVTVSAAARSLEVSSAGTGIDEAKVASVKAAIANGTFTVNPGAIADKLLSNAQEILSRVRN